MTSLQVLPVMILCALSPYVNIEHIDLGTGTNTLFIDSSSVVDFSSFVSVDFLNVTYITDDYASESITGSQGDDVFRTVADNSSDILYGEGGAGTFMFSIGHTVADRIYDFSTLT